MDNKINGIMNELTDMANFKGFGESKEIIIDGVNVAGCEFYQIEANELYPKAQYCGSMRNTFCENEPDCYYKQLKRLEQENKELVHYLACMTEQRNKANTTLQEIKAIVKKNISYQDTDSTTRAMTKVIDLIFKAEEE